ncbi:hypothetical protein GYMLUDRAFT_58898 [Collybiopsis luxurians FD-317 M1]|uniref:Uncharacterized protein n=1 Tax=Collybiopsis luxurians FD-317 M1 TaxID=944289 RepID=A0A0D0CQP2_9AGAR|nr:hypothetical protein GYMLUDRAFT_58898 [Collybiopsis luxurians FD-317 M1]
MQQATIQPIYVSLHEMTPHNPGIGSYHWAIAIPRPSEEYRLDRPLDMFQVYASDSTDYDNDDWCSDHKTGTEPMYLDRLVGVVRLPPLVVTHEEACKFLSSEPSNREGTTLLRGRSTWSCSQWLIRCLKRMEEKGWFSSPPPLGIATGNGQAFYDDIRTKGITYEIMIMNGFAGNSTLMDGIRVLL